MHGLMSGGWRRGTVSGPQRLQLDAWTAPDLSATAPVLDSAPPALRRVLPRVEHRRHKGLNNRAENSHLPTRQRERRMQRFKSSEQAQRFLEPFSTVCNHFRPRRHRLTATTYRRLMEERRRTWREVTAVPSAS
jgi:putative transposase